MEPLWIFFFFQAEDGIRDVAVTGVQTCALPIYPRRSQSDVGWSCARKVIFQHIVCMFGEDGVATREISATGRNVGSPSASGSKRSPRSEERRVGKECSSEWAGVAREENGSEQAR